jgi:hypothetical protein
MTLSRHAIDLDPTQNRIHQGVHKVVVTKTFGLRWEALAKADKHTAVIWSKHQASPKFNACFSKPPLVGKTYPEVLKPSAVSGPGLMGCVN